MSCAAVAKLSCSMAAICSSLRPYDGLTSMRASTPVVCSRALTVSSPSASTVKVTRMRAAPAAIGGMPRSSKRARLRQSATKSRSPCTTCKASAVCPSLNVVKSCAMAVGMVVLRGTMRSTSPPMVSMPSDSGMTSSSSKSPSGLLPASWFAWMAAPSATTSSGFRLTSGGWPNNASTARRTTGMRVEPPTSTTPLTSAGCNRASRSTRRTTATVRSVKAAVAAAKSAPLTDHFSKRPCTSASNGTAPSSGWADRASLTRRASASTAARWVAGSSAACTGQPARASSASAKARS